MDYRFCPRCSHALTVGTPRGEEHPRLVCAECGYIVYRNSKPCAGAVVVREGKVLLARRALPPMQGVWDLPGGFLELGEHPEDGVVRELREETELPEQMAFPHEWEVLHDWRKRAAGRSVPQ